MLDGCRRCILEFNAYPPLENNLSYMVEFLKNISFVIISGKIVNNITPLSFTSPKYYAVTWSAARWMGTIFTK